MICSYFELIIVAIGVIVSVIVTIRTLWLEQHSNVAKDAQPKPGDIYYLENCINDPFDRDKHAVMVKEVKEGWVLYTMGWLFDNETLELNRFLSIYVKSNEPHVPNQFAKQWQEIMIKEGKLEGSRHPLL